MAKSIWAKIGVKATGQVFALVPKALTYPVKKPSASTGEMKHDAIVSLKEAVGIDVPKEEKEYDLPIGTTEASKYLGIQITKQGKGKVIFLASRTLTGDIPYLSTDRLDRIKKDLPNVTIFKEENIIVIEVNVEEIINGIKGDPKNKGKSPEEIRNLIIKGIEEKLDYSLKGLGKITGGEFKDYEDKRWIYGIAEKLYNGYDNQKQRSSEVVGSTGKKRSPEESLNSWQSKVIERNFETIKGKEFKL